MSRIAAAVGLSRTALYKHFPNRRAVLLAAMDVMHGTRDWPGLSSGATVFERLLNMADIRASFSASTDETFARPMFNFIAAADDTDIAQGLSDRHRRFLRGVADLVAQGKLDGSVREDVDSYEIACRVLMFAWAEDVARLVGLDDFITSGVTKRAYRLLMGDVAAAPAATEDTVRSADSE